MPWFFAPFLRKSLFILLALGGLAIPLFGLGLPQVDPVRASMLDGPRSGVGLAQIDATNRLHYIRTSYRLTKTDLDVEVYLSRDPQDLRFGPANVTLPTSQNATLAASALGYRVLAGQPCYLQTRKDGLWILFVFPDEIVDVGGFIRDFNDCLSFFETRLSGAGLADLLPSLIGTLRGVR